MLKKIYLYIDNLVLPVLVSSVAKVLIAIA